MHRPTCELHPTGHVKRDGHYGARKQYVRWRCIPGNGERPHNVRPVLALKQHGGAGGGRAWFMWRAIRSWPLVTRACA
jgi:hypothetical protein